jgi:hypothetical protein
MLKHGITKNLVLFITEPASSAPLMDGLPRFACLTTRLIRPTTLNFCDWRCKPWMTFYASPRPRNVTTAGAFLVTILSKDPCRIWAGG